MESPARPLNLAQYFLLSNLEAGRGDATALVVDHPTDGVSTYTYAALAARSAQVANHLRAQGLGLEDRALLVLEDGVDWVVAFFGAQMAGLTTAFLSPALGAEELAFYLADSRARAVLTSRVVLERLPAERPWLRAAIALDAPETRAAIDAASPEPTLAPTTEEDFAIWLYSSGSTGAPKAAVHRAYDFVYNTERYPREVLGMGPDDRTLSVPKLFFGYATGSNLFFPFRYGGSAILFPDKPTPERLFELIARHAPTILVNVPTMIAQMTAHFERAPSPLGRLRAVVSAGEALPPELYLRFKQRLGVEILDGIGSAEMFHVFISARAGKVVPGSLGTLVDGYEARIVDDEGRALGPGETGILQVKGGSAAAFYWQRHEKSREVLQGPWVISSDRFMRDADGLFWYRGRADDMMKIGGRWLAPQEVEDVLVTHPAVAEAGAAPFEADGLVKPMAFVILRPGASADEAALLAHLDGKLERFKLPRFVEIVSALPRNERDKLARGPLKALAAEAARRRGRGDA